MRQDASVTDGQSGILTLGFGSERYRRLAVNLARSLQLHSPQIARAIVTDEPASMRRWFNHVVPLDPSVGSGFEQKLALSEYTPFETTLFIDSDCLAVRDVREIFDLYAGHDFAVSGREAWDGEWFGADLTKVRFEMGLLGPLPKFNGGIYYWRSSATGKRVFSDAKNLSSLYPTLGFQPMHGRSGAVTDEPLISIALARQGLTVVPDAGTTMRTPLGISGHLRIDVLRGRGSFIKEGQPVSPALIHFCGNWADSRAYRVEALKLKLARQLPIRSASVVGQAFGIGLRTLGGTRRAAGIISRRSGRQADSFQLVT
jgi:hypothetical protein